ncbi:RND efflux system, outer membrane lipoprotein CmeC [Paraburkholderia caribensis MBA4]|uniref:RND efflux system, outer membrane lipoprotein CmeC n=1 Tax=Paraburkholderia caribensis MBA4 TaxID=1323664 RepID=A0A0P0R5C3_9BURK|nr:efflux transporter outer membrane subunit [Paraburkholderia caribensis]ALL63113.1 RND efflux system, outer membrane lipoprotein CmeC [Paraburkholderia caribensis MBA4]
MNTCSNWTLLGLLTATLAASGCSLAPQYEKPMLNVPAAFKEADLTVVSQTDASAGQSLQWKTAVPADAQSRGAWWTLFGDPALDALEDEARAANPSLAVAAARVKASRAIQQVARAGMFPSLDAGFGPTRQKFSPASQFLPDSAKGPVQTFWRAQAGASYEVDLFGRVSDTVAATRAEEQQSEALYSSVLLALQADIAQGYFNVRELDAELDVLSRTVSLREEALQLVHRRYDHGDVSELDLAQARSELAATRSDMMTVTRARAAAEHRLAALLGKTPAEFTFATSALQPVTVTIPPGLPSALLERRPDIAAAERAMAAANARIGVARSAFFPSLSLTASGGFESASLGDLMMWTSRTFLLGPLAGAALTLPLFDGGRRSGNLANAVAMHEESVANYRQQVLTAFREVEDNLSELRILKDQRITQDAAVDASSRALQLSRKQYLEGAVSYLEVIDNERNTLQLRLASTQLAGAQATSTVNLIRGLGGGWETPATVTGR